MAIIISINQYLFYKNNSTTIYNNNVLLLDYYYYLDLSPRLGLWLIKINDMKYS